MESRKKCARIAFELSLFLYIFVRFLLTSQPIKHQFQRIDANTNSTLILRNVQRHHEGNYTCNVKNQLGSDQIVYQLYVHVPPGPPELRVTSTTSTTVTLEWTLEGEWTHARVH